MVVVGLWCALVQTTGKMATPTEEETKHMNVKLGELKELLATRLKHADEDNRFADVVIPGYHRLLNDMEVCVANDPAFRERRIHEFNSYKCILDGMTYQKSRAVGETGTFAPLLARVDALLEAPEYEKYLELRKEIHAALNIDNLRTVAKTVKAPAKKKTRRK